MPAAHDIRVPAPGYYRHLGRDQILLHSSGVTKIAGDVFIQNG
jgi:hypothetical protein